MMALRHEREGITLARLLEGMAELDAAQDRNICGIALDSRKAGRGHLFLACPGERTSGIHYIREAIQAGAAAVAVDAASAAEVGAVSVPVVPVAGLAGKAGLIAGRFFGEPSSALRVVGITGTNGKTSVSHYIAGALAAGSGHSPAVIGTLGYGRSDVLSPALLTTPDPVTLQQLFAQLRDGGVDVVAMEVSSHALRQGRVAGVHFELGVFTNLSREHLDYHGEMAAYGAAKRQLFHSPGLATGIINLDDDFGRQMHAELRGGLPLVGYRLAAGGEGTDGAAREVTGVVLRDRVDRLELDVNSPWGRGRLECRLTGRFNASNLLASLAALCLLDIPFERALEQLRNANPVPGRMESFKRPDGPRVVVDYAHTPDALAQVLGTLRSHCAGALVCVFGCGGDRDRGKRREMGAVAEALSDRVVVTSDNPRTEPPEQIIHEILEGMKGEVPVEVQPDRAAAIAAAIRTAGVDDVILVAGKGHETWQEIAGIRYPFSDRQLVRNLLEEGA